jgi:uncharacterized protein (DUF362 family)/ferredoxin
MHSTVSVVENDTYEPGAVRRAIVSALVPLGGIERFVRPGMTVLLKPNLLAALPLEQAATTHPAVVLAVADLVREAGGRPLIGDSPAGSDATAGRACRRSPLALRLQEAGLEAIHLQDAAWRQRGGRAYYIASAVLDADLVINLPKLKTHVYTLYTGAVKNLFGTVPGHYKQEIHCLNARLEDFSARLVDLLELVKPGLTIMDAILGQEGTGPGAGGTPRPYGCLAAAEDPVALDTVMAGAMGYDLASLWHLAQAGARALGTADPAAIRVVGHRPYFGRVEIPRPAWYSRVPSWLLRPAARVYPQLRDPQACTGCGMCAEICPAGAITAGRPVLLSRDNCISCFCCIEACPQGLLEPHRNYLNRAVGRLIQIFLARAGTMGQQ